MARGRGECIALGRGGMDSTWPRERWIARCRGGGWSWIAHGRREVDGTWLVGGMLISHGHWPGGGGVWDSTWPERSGWRHCTLGLVPVARGM